MNDADKRIIARIFNTGNTDVFFFGKMLECLEAARKEEAQEIIRAIDKEGNTGYDDLCITQEFWVPFKRRFRVE